jgi:hypothetical protein
MDFRATGRKIAPYEQCNLESEVVNLLTRSLLARSIPSWQPEILPELSSKKKMIPVSKPRSVRSDFPPPPRKTQFVKNLIHPIPNPAVWCILGPPG